MAHFGYGLAAKDIPPAHKRIVFSGDVLMSAILADRLVDRFFRYVAVTSQSDGHSAIVPSTPGQWDVARLLKAELKALGLSDVHLDENAILTAHLPATVAGQPKIGFCAHMDTVDVGLSAEIRPRKIYFEGTDVCLNAKTDFWVRVAERPEFLPYAGQDIIVGDGTSVLGADNKAAVAVVMELLAELVREKPDHGDVYVSFVPDEEIGLRGAKIMDLERFPVDWAYTIDACALGEFVYETFNAAQVSVMIEGVTAHPISAKNVLVNPILVAQDLIARFDPLQTPEHTEEREGYVWVNGMEAGQATARLSISIRDFDAANFAARKDEVRNCVAATQAAFPRATLTCEISDAYANIASCMGNDRRSVALLEEAFAKAGVEPRVLPMRGGTDGSALSARGIPTPNFFTGGLNFHSPFEFLPVPSFVKAYEVARALLVR